VTGGLSRRALMTNIELYGTEVIHHVMLSMGAGDAPGAW
jgi:hypothetical protein